MIILERFEGETAVLEIDGVNKTVSRKRLAAACREGDVLIEKDDIYIPDEDMTKARRQQVAELQDSLFD